MQRLRGLNFRKPYRSFGRISEEKESVKRGIMSYDEQSTYRVHPGLMQYLATRTPRKIPGMILFHPKWKVILHQEISKLFL